MWKTPEKLKLFFSGLFLGGVCGITILLYSVLLEDNPISLIGFFVVESFFVFPLGVIAALIPMLIIICCDDANYGWIYLIFICSFLGAVVDPIFRGAFVGEGLAVIYCLFFRPHFNTGHTPKDPSG